MTLKLHEKIRDILTTTPGLTQRGLAERMGLNPAAVNRMLYGRRNIMVDELPLIEDYLGVRLDLHGGGEGGDYLQTPVTPRGFSDVRAAMLDMHAPTPAQSAVNPSEATALQTTLVPVYDGLRGGEIVDWVVRHPLQLGVRDAYALYVQDEEMQPRYFRGETIYVHPAKPVMTGSDCVVEMGDGRVLLRRLVQKTAQGITVQQFHPQRLVEILSKDMSALYSIIGRS